jgi:hypothetical protein
MYTIRHFLSELRLEFMISMFAWPRSAYANVKVTTWAKFGLQKLVQGCTEHPMNREVMSDPSHPA